MKVIVISGKAQHGKDTAARYLKEALESDGYRVLITHYADLLKYICKSFFDWNGKKDEDGRSILQYVGTDIIRHKQPDYWVDFIVNILELFNDEWDYVLIPDCRFPNELYGITLPQFETTHLRVVRENFVSPLTPEQQQHESEIAMDNIKPDYCILNNGTLSDLRKNVVDWLVETNGLHQISLDEIVEDYPEKSLTILVDMDDTIENLLEAWVDYLNFKNGVDVSPEDINEWDITRAYPMLSEEQIFEPLYDHDFWYTVTPKEGAADVLQQLINDGHRVLIVTSSYLESLRSKMMSVLFNYFPFLCWDDVIVTAHKQLIKGDVMIDDGAHNLEGGDYAKLLMDAPHNKYYDAEANGMMRVHNWEEIYKVIEGLKNKHKEF